MPRRAFLKGAAAAGAAALGGAALWAERTRHKGDIAAADMVAFLEGGEAPALAERGITLEKAAAVIEAMLAEDHQGAIDEARTPWDRPLSQEAVHQVLREFAVMVRVEERFGDALERTVEGAAEEMARHTGINTVRTFGPAEVNPHTARAHALRHAAVLAESRWYDEGTLAQLKETNSAATLAHLLRLSEDGAVLWGGYLFSRGMDIYGRDKRGMFQLENKRTLSLTYASYSATEYTPAVSALQNVVNDLGVLSGVLDSPIAVDGDLGKVTESAVRETLAALRAQGYPSAALQREVRRFLALHEEKEEPLLLARAAWRVMHQAGALQRQLFGERITRTEENDPVLAHLVAHRYSASVEAYMRLYDAVEENLAPQAAARALAALKELFRAYVFENDRRFVEFLAQEEPFVAFFSEVMAEEVRAPAADALPLHRAWVEALLRRLPQRWASDGKFLGTVPTARKVGWFTGDPRTLFVQVDRNIFGRVLLAYEMAGGKYALNLGLAQP